MKKVKYLKGLILGAFVFLVGILISLGTMEGVDVHADETIDLSYNVYAYDDYVDNVLPIIENWYIDSEAYSGHKNPDKGWDGTATNKQGGVIYPHAMEDDDDYEECAGYYWADVFGQTGSTLSYSDCYSLFLNYLSSSSLSEVNEGDYVVIVPMIDAGSIVLGTVAVGMDMTNLTAVTPSTTTYFSGKLKPLSDGDIKTGTNGDNYIYYEGNGNIYSSVTNAFSSTSNYPKIELSDSNEDEFLTSAFVLGAYATKVGSGSSFTIQALNDSDYTYAQKPDGTDVAFNEHTKPLTIQSSTSNVAEIAKVKFGTTDYATTTSVTLNGVNYDTFVMPSVSDSTNSVTVNITTSRNGTLSNGQTNLVSTDDNTATMSSLSISGTVSPYSITLTPTTWNTGESIYAKVTVTATDNTTTKDYLIQFEKDKYTDKELSDLTFVSDGIRPNETTPYADLYNAGNTAATSFASGTLNYYLRVANNTTQVSFTPEWNLSKKMKVEYDSTVLTYTNSGATPPTFNVSFTSGTTKLVTIKVTAQNTDYSQEYKITLYRLDNDTDITGIAVRNNSGTAATISPTFSTSVYSYTADVAYGSTAYKAKVTLKNTSKQKLEYTTDSADDIDDGVATWHTIASNSFTSNISYSSGTGSETLTIFFRVTAEDGKTTQIYQIDAERSGGDKNSKLPSTSVDYRFDSGTATTATFTTTSDSTYPLYKETGNATVSNVAYKTKGVQLKITCDTTKGQTISYRYKYDTGSYGASINSNSAVWTPTIYFDGATSGAYGTTDATSITIEITIKAQDTSYESVYEFTIDRKAASDDKALSNLDIYLTKTGSADYTLVTAASFDPTTKTYTHTSNVDYSYKGIKVAPTFNTLATATTEATIGTTPTSQTSISTGVKSTEYAFTGTSSQTITIKIVVKAEDNSSETYTVIITRAAAEDDKNMEFKIYSEKGALVLLDTPVTVGSSTIRYTATTTSLAFENRYVEIAVKMHNPDSRSKVKADLYDQTGSSLGSGVEVSDNVGRNYYFDYDSSPTIVAMKLATGTIKVFTFKLYTEATGSGYYTIEIRIERDAADNDATLNGTPSFVGVNDSESYTYESYTASSLTYKYVMTKSTSGTDYVLGVNATSSKSKIYYSYSVPTPSSSIKLYDAGFAAQFGTLYDQTSTNPSDHTFTAGTSGQNLYITVVPESGQYKTYVFNVGYKDERQEGHEITDITVTVVNAKSNTFAFSQVTGTADVPGTNKDLGKIVVPYSTQTVEVHVTFNSTTSDKATINSVSGYICTEGTISLVEGSNYFLYQGKAENTGLGCEYVFEIERESAKTENYLEKLTVGSTTLVDLSDTTSTTLFNNQGTIYTALSRNTSFINVKFVVSTFAKYTISGAGITAQSATQTTAGAEHTVSLTGMTPGNKYTLNLTIQSEKEVFDSSATLNPFTIEIYTAEQNFTVDNIELYRDNTLAYLTADKDGNNYTFNPSATTPTTMNLAYKNNKKAYAEVTLNVNSSNATVVKSGTAGELTLADGMNTYTITVKSEYASLNPSITDQQKVYTIKLNRDAPSHVATLDNLVLTNQSDGNATLSFRDATFSSSDFGQYIVENIAVNSSNKAFVKFTPTLTNPLSTYTISQADASNVVLLDKSSDPTATITTIVEIKVVAEDETNNNTYYVKISTGTVVLSTDNGISNIVVNTDNDSTTSIITYSSSQTSYNPTVRPNVNSVNITVTLHDAAAAIYTTVDGSAEDMKKSNGGQAYATFNVALTNKPGNTVIEIISRAQDTSVADKKYTITVKSSTADPDKSLKTYKIEVIDDSNVVKSTYNYSASDTNPVINVKNDETKVKLYVEVNSLYATVSPSNAGDNRKYDLTKDLVIDENTISFVVTAEDTTSEPYTIKVIRDDDNTLDNLEIVKQDDATSTNLITFPAADNKFSVTVDYSVDKLDFSYILNASNASYVTVTSKVGTTAVTGSTINLNVGLNTFILSVAAKSTAKTDYIVSITRNDGNNQNYIITYRHDATQPEIHSYDTTTTDGTFVSSANTIVYMLNRDYIGKTYDPVLTVSSTAKSYDGIQYKIVQSNRLLALGTNNFTIVVTSETNQDREYNFTIYVADQSAAIDNMYLYKSGTTTNMVDVNNNTLNYNAGTPNYSLTYKYSQKDADLFLGLASSYANVKINNNGLSKGSNPQQYTALLNIDNANADSSGNIVFTIKVEAEILTYYNVTDPTVRATLEKTYTITITKEAPNIDTSLLTLTVQAGSKVYNIISNGTLVPNADIQSIGTTIFTLEKAGQASSYNITAVPNKLPTLTSFEQLTYNEGTHSATKSIPFATTGPTSRTYSFLVYNEAHDAFTEYTITIYRDQAIDPNTNNEISMIDLYDSLNVSYINNSIFNQTINTYTFGTNGISTISYGLNKSYTIVVTIPSTSNATVYIDGVASANKQSGAISITYPATGNYTRTHTVYAISQSGDQGTIYTINVVAVRADSVSTLTNILIDSNSIVDKNGVRFIQSKLDYDLGTYDNTYFEVNVFAVLANQNQKAQIISSAGETFSNNSATVKLNVGNNTINIVVTAEDGVSNTTYQVIIFRDYEEPVLVDLAVVGETLVNSTYNDPLDFDSETKHYYVKLLYGTTNLTVNASLSIDSQNYTVVTNGLTAQNNTGVTRTFTAVPHEGVTNYTITVRSPQGKTNKYTLTVKLNDSSTASTNISLINPTSPTYDVIAGIVTTPTGRIVPELSGIVGLPGVELTNTDGTPKEFKLLSGITTDYSNGDLIQSYGPYVVANKVRSLNSSVLNITAEKLKDATGAGAQVTFLSGNNLNIGDNKVVVQVTSEDGNNVRTVVLDIVRLDNAYTLSIDEIDEFEDDFDEGKVNDNNTPYVVDSSTMKLNFHVANKDTSDTIQPTVKVISDEFLTTGYNTVKVLITPQDGSNPFEQDVLVYREPYAFEVSSQAIADVKPNYADGQLNGKSYTVPSKVSKLDLSVINPEGKNDSDAPIWTLTNDGNLKPGTNELILTIDAPDGTRAQTKFTVVRTPMAYDVNKTLNEFACEEVSGKPNFYKINLIDKTATAIKDYSEYITFDATTNDLVVEDLTGEKTKDTTEVILRVSTKDGTESEIVHLQLESKAIGSKGSIFDLIFWIILGIVLILLIIILICVNRDKYGSVSKKRKA